MAEEFVRYFDVDGEKRPLAASNLKKSGRLVIGIAGTHTLDDADILFGANESDASANQELLNNAIQKGGFGELFFLYGTFYFECGISASIVHGCGSGSKLVMTRDDGGDYAVNAGVVKNIWISATANIKQYGKHAMWFDYGGEALIDNVWITDFSSGIEIYSGDNIEIRRCRIHDCTIGIHVSSSRNITIQGCEIIACQQLINASTNEENIRIIGNKFDDNSVYAYDCIVRDNENINDTDLSNCFTTIGATKLTEEKVKALNKLPDNLGTKYTYTYEKGYFLHADLPKGVYIVTFLAHEGYIIFTFLYDSNSDENGYNYVYSPLFEYLNDTYKIANMAGDYGETNVCVNGDWVTEGNREYKLIFTRIF